MISQDSDCKLCHETVPLIRHIELQSAEIIRLKEQSRHLTNERDQLKRQIDEIGLKTLEEINWDRLALLEAFYESQKKLVTWDAAQ